MTDHPDIPHDSIPALPSGTVGVLLRIALDALEKAGYKRLADRIRNVPSLASDILAKLIKVVFGSIARGTPIDDEAAKKIETILESTQRLTTGEESHPQKPINVSIPVEPTLLELYAQVFGIVCDAMKHGNFSLALRGFVHDPDCISYWHLKGASPTFSAISNYLYPNNLEVYIINGRDNSPKELDSLNKSIRRGQAPGFINNINDATVVQVHHVYEFDLEVRGLRPDRDELMKRPDPFNIRILDYNQPQLFTIPFGDDNKSGLLGMLDSLTDAVLSQDSYRTMLKNGLAMN